VQHEPFLADLGGMGVVVVEFAVDDPDHHRLADLEGPGGEHAFALGVSALELVAAGHVACSLKDQLYLQADQRTNRAFPHLGDRPQGHGASDRLVIPAS
jgi:hypothetical protein